MYMMEQILGRNPINAIIMVRNLVVIQEKARSLHGKFNGPSHPNGDTQRLGTTFSVFLGQFYIRIHFLYLCTCSRFQVINTCHVCDGH